MTKKSLQELKQELQNVNDWLNSEGSGQCEHKLCDRCGESRFNYIKRKRELMILIENIIN